MVTPLCVGISMAAVRAKACWNRVGVGGGVSEGMIDFLARVREGRGRGAESDFVVLENHQNCVRFKRRSKLP